MRNMIGNDKWKENMNSLLGDRDLGVEHDRK